MKQRSAVVLRYYLDMPEAEVAEAMQAWWGELVCEANRTDCTFAYRTVARPPAVMRPVMEPREARGSECQRITAPDQVHACNSGAGGH